MSIAGMIVWILTAGIGIYLLAVLGARRQAARDAQPRAGAPAVAAAQSADGATVVGAAALASLLAPESGGTRAGPGEAAGPRSAAGPGRATGAQGSPLLEFMHPLLAVTGLMFWIFFVMTDYRLFAWLAFGVVVAAVLAGLGWVAYGRRMARRAARTEAGGHVADEQVAIDPEGGHPEVRGSVAGERVARERVVGERVAGGPGDGFPAHLVVIHGLAAACTLALVVISALTAAHG